LITLGSEAGSRDLHAPVAGRVARGSTLEGGDLAADGAVRLDMGDVITVALNDMLVRIEQQLDRLDENGASDA